MLTETNMAQKPKILVTDDDPALRKIISRFLEIANYDPLLAENGKITWSR